MDDPEPAEVFEDNVRALRSALRACIKQLEDLPEEDAAAAAGVLSTARLFERLQDDARAALASPANPRGARPGPRRERERRKNDGATPGRMCAPPRVRRRVR